MYVLYVCRVSGEAVSRENNARVVVCQCGCECVDEDVGVSMCVCAYVDSGR